MYIADKSDICVSPEAVILAPAPNPGIFWEKYMCNYCVPTYTGESHIFVKAVVGKSSGLVVDEIVAKSKFAHPLPIRCSSAAHPLLISTDGRSSIESCTVT